MPNVRHNLENIKLLIKVAIKHYAAEKTSVQLLAVSKARSCEEIRAAYQVGQVAFGENYLQEALPKIKSLADLPLEWHFIGRVQSNKTKQIAAYFSWIHSVCSLKVAERLNEQRPQNLAPLNICIQVNTSQEPTKAGAKLEELPKLVSLISQLPNIHLRGLMALPAPVDPMLKGRVKFEAQRQAYKKLYSTFLDLKKEFNDLDTLSIGTSQDFMAAIAEGATIVRIGTDIFGTRRQ